MVLVVGETEREPLVDLAPDQPLEAVQVVALVLDQVRVLAWPEVIERGEAERERVGAVVGGGGVVQVEEGEQTERLREPEVVRPVNWLLLARSLSLTEI